MFTNWYTISTIHSPNSQTMQGVTCAEVGATTTNPSRTYFVSDPTFQLSPKYTSTAERHILPFVIDDNKSGLADAPAPDTDLATTAYNKKLVEELKVFDHDSDEPLFVEVAKLSCSDFFDAYHEEQHRKGDWGFEFIDGGNFEGVGTMDSTGHDDRMTSSADAQVTTPLPLPKSDCHQYCLRTPTQARKVAPKRSCDDTRRLVRRKCRKRPRQCATNDQLRLGDKIDSAIESAICSRRKSKWTQPEQALKLRVSVEAHCPLNFMREFLFRCCLLVVGRAA